LVIISDKATLLLMGAQIVTIHLTLLAIGYGSIPAFKRSQFFKREKRTICLSSVMF
jgi:uncharacterized membrane protein YwzB